MMNKQLKIKVCGMTIPENMMQVAELGVDYLGFIFYPKSPRYMVNTLRKKDLERLPASIKKTGVFVNETADDILHQAQNFGLDAIQLHGKETPSLCSEIRSHKLDVFKAFSVDEHFDPASILPYEEVVDYVLLDTKTKMHGGSGKKFDWRILDKIKTSRPIILSGGIGPDDTDEINKLDHLNIYALDLNSKFEIEPGLKNVELLKQFLKQITNGDW